MSTKRGHVLQELLHSDIVDVAKSMLAEEVGIVAGCRRLVRLYHCLDEENEELFGPIIAVESETDDLPLGETRSLWSKEALAGKEAEASAYLGKVRRVIFEACKNLVRFYSSPAR